MKCLTPIQISVACADKDEAQKIAKVLLEQNLAACCQITENLLSIYKWQGKVEQANECMLVIKSVRSCFEQISQQVKRIHSYQVAEIIALEIQEIEPAYEQWLLEQINSKTTPISPKNR
ncbi:divalent-cation tolerance protein CutA [Catenovulum agarivorans]|uniref:divalent-cation tolerance protein CutA n=1 Tax=Catenovulum agarivorans TaxID=1172192 RepID=UPI00036C602D|nr:divalent cation tolerance protein CutA [Catenovulum agarivorans]